MYNLKFVKTLQEMDSARKYLHSSRYSVFFKNHTIYVLSFIIQNNLELITISNKVLTRSKMPASLFSFILILDFG